MKILPRAGIQSGIGLCSTSCLLGIALFTPSAIAAGYPDKPIRLIVAAAAGGGADLTARTLQPSLNEVLGQSIVVDNRAGASGIIGIELVAKAVPDGYTLLLNTSTHTTLPATNAKLPFDVAADFAPVSLVVSQPNILVIHPSVPAQSVKELVAIAKAKPDTINFASGGNGTSTHLAGELLKLIGGVRMTHVPFKGTGYALPDLLGGHVQMMFCGPLSIAQHIKTGRLRVLAVADKKRSRIFPEVSTMAEAGFAGVETGTWYGIAAPAKTPKPVVDKLYAAIKQVVQSPELKARFDAQGVDIVANSPAEFRLYIADQIMTLSKVVRAAGLRRE